MGDPARVRFSTRLLAAKAATAIWRKSITISGACPSGDIRCGQPSITSNACSRWHDARARFLGPSSLTCLKQGAPMSVPYLRAGNENASLYSGIDVLNLSRLKRIPPVYRL